MTPLEEEFIKTQVLIRYVMWDAKVKGDYLYDALMATTYDTEVINLCNRHNLVAYLPEKCSWASSAEAALFKASLKETYDWMVANMKDFEDKNAN